MEEPVAHPEPADLLDELTRLHQLLAEPAGDVIPVLQDVVQPPAAPGSLQHLRPLLMSSAEHILQEVIRDFSPQITAELEKRLHQHLQQLISEQEQIRLAQHPDSFP